MTARTTRSSPRKRPGVADLSPEVVYYLTSRGYDVAKLPQPLFRTPEPRTVRGAVFDPARVDRKIKALRALRHTKGKWANRPLDPAPWQVAFIIAPVFGWVAPDDEGNLQRIIREVYLEMPRKGGKTTLGAGLITVVTFADDEPGADSILAAAGRDQALLAFKPIAAVARGSKLLRDAGVRALARTIEQPSTQSLIKTASSRADLSHGENIHAALVDELHVHKSPDVLEAIETGTGSRSQPLVIVITTADDGKRDSAYAERREAIEKLARGVIKAPSRYGVIFALSSATTTKERLTLTAIAAANPSYPVTPTKAYAVAAIEKAQTSPIAMASYERLHLGIRSSRDVRYIDLDRWDRNKGTRIDEAELAGRPAFGGLDLGSTSDLTALTWLFKRDAGGWDLLCRFWMPEAALDRLDKRTHRNGSAWVKNGWITLTPGDVTDYDFVRQTIDADREAFDVEGIGYDRWNSSQMVIDLTADGAPMVKVGQGFASMSAPLKELHRLTLVGRPGAPQIRHGGNPVMRWMVDNLRAAEDPAGNVKPDKKTSMDKIDGVSAAVTALAVALGAEPEQESVYERRDVLVL